MRPLLTRVLTGAALLVLAACGDDRARSAEETPTGPEASLRSTATSATTAANFSWLAPLGAGTADPNAFDAAAAPVVEICLWVNGACSGSPVARFSTTPQPGEGSITINAGAGRYEASWSLLSTAFTTRRTYRIRALRTGTELGAVSVDVVRGRWGLTRTDGTLAPLASASALPIRFTITPQAPTPPVTITLTRAPGTIIVGVPTTLTLTATATSQSPILTLRIRRDGPFGPGDLLPSATCTVTGLNSASASRTCSIPNFTGPTGERFLADVTTESSGSANTQLEIDAVAPEMTLTFTANRSAMVAGVPASVTFNASATSQAPIQTLVIQQVLQGLYGPFTQDLPSGSCAAATGIGTGAASRTCTVTTLTAPSMQDLRFRARVSSPGTQVREADVVLDVTAPEITLDLSSSRNAVVAGLPFSVTFNANATSQSPISSLVIRQVQPGLQGTFEEELPAGACAAATGIGTGTAVRTCTVPLLTAPGLRPLTFRATLRAAGDQTRTDDVSITVTAPNIDLQFSANRTSVPSNTPTSVTFEAQANTQANVTSLTIERRDAIIGDEPLPPGSCAVSGIGNTFAKISCTITITTIGPQTFVAKVNTEGSASGERTLQITTTPP